MRLNIRDLDNLCAQCGEDFRNCVCVKIKKKTKLKKDVDFSTPIKKEEPHGFNYRAIKTAI